MSQEGKQPPFDKVIDASVKDMRNSLGQVLYKLDALHSELPDDAAVRKDLSNAEYEVSRIQNVLSQLHGLYLMETGSLIVQMQETYVFELVEDMLASVEALLKNSDVEIELKGEDLNWYLDPHLIADVLHISILNAIRYTKDRVVVELSERDGGLVIAVVDNGKGYPDSVIEDFNMLCSGETLLHVSSQNIGWLYCEKVAELHKNHEKKGGTKLSNDPVTHGGRLEICLP